MRGLASLPRLRDAPDAVQTGGVEVPTVSVVVAARDEAPHIARAILTLLRQDYPRFEVVAVDDRSSDGTGQILDHMRDPRLKVLHVTELPDGWLGKNYALERGARVATGELLLFTDADVHMRPDALRRAVGLLERDRLDHLAVTPRIDAGTRWARAVVAVFLVVFSTFFRPWKAVDPRSPWFIGVGAFNLVRTDAYRAVGGHGSVALRPDDDVRLGRELKRAGYRQAAASGAERVQVEWYPSVGAMARGLRKNAFAVARYRLSLVAAGTALPIVFIFWPLTALLVTSGATWWLNLVVVLTGALVTGSIARGSGLPAWTGAVYPLAAATLLWIIWSAALRAVLRGSIEWRGTEYPLSRLRLADQRRFRRAGWWPRRRGGR